MLVQRNDWTYDTQTATLSAYGESHVLPEVSQGTMAMQSLGYAVSQVAPRDANTALKRKAADRLGVQISKLPKDTKLPDADSDEYKAELTKATRALFDKYVSGWELGVREGSGDPLADEIDNFKRAWFQVYAKAKRWYDLPPKKKIARDEDPYANAKHGSTFGEALEKFAQLRTPAKKYLLVDPATNKPWPVSQYCRKWSRRSQM